MSDGQRGSRLANICFDQLVNNKAWPGDSVTTDEEIVAFAKVLAVLGALLVLRDDPKEGERCRDLAAWLFNRLFTVDRIVTALFDDQAWDGHVFVSTRVPRHGMSSHTKFSSNSPGDSHGCLLFQPEAGGARASRLQFGAPVLPPITRTWRDSLVQNQLIESGLVVANISRPPISERCRFYTSFSMRSHRLWITCESQRTSVANIVVEWQNKAYSYNQHCWDFVDAICKTIGCSRMRDAFVLHSIGFRKGIEGLKSDHTKHVVPSSSAPTGVSSVGTPPVLWEEKDTHTAVDAAHSKFRETLFACRWNDSDLSPQYLADMDEFVAYALGIHMAHQLSGEECTLLDKRSAIISTPL